MFRGCFVAENARIPVVILAGGKGLRLFGEGPQVPKALIEIGGQPIIWHVMRLYARYGFRRFVLCLGHRGLQIRQFFTRHPSWRSDSSNRSFERDVIGTVADIEGDTWQVILADTGETTNTGGRIRRVRRYLDEESFCATYADGLSDVDLASVAEFHLRHDRTATLTTVNPSCQFGILSTDGQGRVRRFIEKPKLALWINGGFFVFRSRVFSWLAEDTDLERELLPRLAGSDQLTAYRHRGFWASMDTYKDVLALNALAHVDRPPWWGLPDRALHEQDGKVDASLD